MSTMSTEQLSHRGEVGVANQAETEWTVVDVNGQPRVHTPDSEELTLFAPPLLRFEAVVREIDAIERRMQSGETSDILSIKHDLLSVEVWQLRELCVSMGLLPETIQ